jgi:hypothetical protein
MEKQTAQDVPGSSWVLWVTGWVSLVGGMLFVLPAALIWGTVAGAWVAGAVATVAVGMAWLAAEAVGAWAADRETSAVVAVDQRSVAPHSV